MSLFQQDQRNMIDFVLNSTKYGDTRFHAENITQSKLRGVETSIRWNLPDQFLNSTIVFNYTYLNSKISFQSSDTSRYAFTHPRHQIGATLIASPFSALNVSFSAVHKIKLNGTSYTLIDSKLAGTYSSFTAYIKETNLLNEKYEEIVGVTLPGRWLWGGIEYTLSLQDVL